MRGMSAPQIAGVVRTDESHVHKVIHAFNERGFDSLDPEYRGASEADHACAA
jgi:transposase